MGQIHVFAVFLLYSGHILVELFVTSFQPRGKRMKRRLQSLVRRQDWHRARKQVNSIRQTPMCQPCWMNLKVAPLLSHS